MQLPYSAVQDIADTAGLPDSAIYPAYSGRAMYGATCLGYEVSGDAQYLRLGAAIAAVLDPVDAEDVLADVRIDSLGLDSIVYFPDVSVESMPDPVG
jgi:hypothetical protein